MADFPQTYQIVRQGAVTPVTVRKHEEVVTLRTELELMSGFAHGATPEIVEALEARLAAVQPGDAQQGGRTANDIQDMLGILRDAMDPATTAAIARIDADFPQARGEIDMASVQKESGDFQEDVSKQVAASGKPAAAKLSRTFKQALLKNAVAAKEAAMRKAAPSDAPGTGPAADAVRTSGQQTSSSETVPVEAANAAPKAPEADPVEAALEEVLSATGEALDAGTAQGGDLSAAEEDSGGEEALSVEGLQTPEAVPVQQVTKAEGAAEVGEASAAQKSSEAESPDSGAELGGKPGARDPVEAALAEAIEEAGGIDERTGDPVGAALAEAANTAGQPDSVERAEQVDPVEAILAEQAAAGEPNAPSAEALEKIMAEQTEAAENKIPPEQLAEVMLAGQLDSAPTAEEVDDTIEEEWANEVQVRDVSQLEPEAGSIEETLKYAGDHVERNTTNADQDTPVSPQDDASGADVAAEEVAQVIEATRGEIDAIASAFEEATSGLGTISDDVSDLASAMDASSLPEAAIDDLAEIPELAQQLGLSPSGMCEDVAGAVSGVGDGSSAAAAFDLPSLNVREELQAIRQTVQSGLDRLIRLLDSVDRTHIEAENRLAQARTFQEAAQRAQEVSEKLVQAQTDAAEARAAYESARRRLEEAQSQWEDARRAAEDAAF